MKNNSIDFNQQRDFGELLNATFAFFRQNVKIISKAMLFYVCPFLLLQGITRVYLDLSFAELAGVFLRQGFGIVTTPYFFSLSLMFLSAILSSLMTSLAVYSIIHLYIEKGNDGFKLEEVWKRITVNFVRILIASVLTSFLVVAGVFMCGVPGVYLYVSTSFILMIMIYENKPFKESFKRSFALVHYHWWAVFLMLLVIFVILNVVSLVFTIPQAVINSFYNVNTLNPNSDSEIMKYVQIVLTMLSTLAYGFLGSIMYIALSFQYFSFVERKESPQLMKKIEAMRP